MADRASATKFAVQTNKRRSDQAFQQILAVIFEGRLSPGSRLPGERELTETIGLSRTTLRDALNRLEARGYINRRSKSGSFVCTSLPQPFREPIEEIVDSNVISTSDIIEIRKVLELWAVDKATELPAKDSLTALARCLRAMEATSAFRSDSQFIRYRDADLKFHQTIAEMTGNLLYVHLFHFFLDLVRRSISLSRQLVPGNFAKDNLRNHREIYRAIERKGQQGKARHAGTLQYVEQHISPRRRRMSRHNKGPRCSAPCVAKQSLITLPSVFSYQNDIPKQRAENSPRWIGRSGAFSAGWWDAARGPPPPAALRHSIPSSSGELLASSRRCGLVPSCLDTRLAQRTAAWQYTNRDLR